MGPGCDFAHFSRFFFRVLPRESHKNYKNPRQRSGEPRFSRKIFQKFTKLSENFRKKWEKFRKISKNFANFCKNFEKIAQTPRKNSEKIAKIPKKMGRRVKIFETFPNFSEKIRVSEAKTIAKMHGVAQCWENKIAPKRKIPMPPRNKKFKNSRGCPKTRMPPKKEKWGR
jgi:hypothetical protein